MVSTNKISAKCKTTGKFLSYKCFSVDQYPDSETKGETRSGEAGGEERTKREAEKSGAVQKTLQGSSSSSSLAHSSPGTEEVSGLGFSGRKNQGPDRTHLIILDPNKKVS